MLSFEYLPLLPTAEAILDAFTDQHVLIVGDVMLDRYLTGSVARISPEAPVPVVHHRATEDRLGGAANVALNIRALGGIPLLCSVVGADADGRALRALLPEQGMSETGLLSSTERCTTVKTRVLGNNQQMLRIDHEDVHELTEPETAQFLPLIERLFDTYPVRVVILQDYNKGVLTPGVIEAVLAEARRRGIPTVVDPKKANFFAYRGVDLFKPNLKEMRDSAPFAIGSDAPSLARAAAFLRERLGHRITMITLSEKGLFLEESDAGKLYPTVPRNVADVSGAGDTVISVAALGLAAKLDLPLIAALSNLAGGQVCEFAGVVPVRKQLLATELAAWLGNAD